MLSLHREGLPGAGGSVGEEQLVLTAEEVLHLGTDQAGEDLLLTLVRLEDPAEGEVMLHLAHTVDGVLVGLGVPGGGEVHLELAREEDRLLCLPTLGVGFSEPRGDFLLLGRLRFDPDERKVKSEELLKISSLPEVDGDVLLCGGRWQHYGLLSTGAVQVI